MINSKMLSGTGTVSNKYASDLTILVIIWHINTKAFMYAVVAFSLKKTIIKKKTVVGTNATKTYISQL